MSERKMSKMQSFGWGLLCALAGGVVGLIFLILLYYLFLKKKNVDIVFYLLGYLIFAIIFMAMIGSIFTFWWITSISII